MSPWTQQCQHGLSHQGERILDLLHAKVKDPHSSTYLRPLGRSSHNLIHLTPRYVSIVKREPVSIRRWSEEAVVELQGWGALYEPHGEDMSGLTECISD